MKVVHKYKMPALLQSHRYQKQSCLVRSKLLTCQAVIMSWHVMSAHLWSEVIPANVGYREAQGGVKFGDPAGNDARDPLLPHSPRCPQRAAACPGRCPRKGFPACKRECRRLRTATLRAISIVSRTCLAVCCTGVSSCSYITVCLAKSCAMQQSPSHVVNTEGLCHSPR